MLAEAKLSHRNSQEYVMLVAALSVCVCVCASMRIYVRLVGFVRVDQRGRNRKAHIPSVTCSFVEM